MNERIEGLWRNARIGSVNNHQNPEVLEKFAQLIVSECVDVLNKRFMGDLNREDMEVRQCIADVKKHFGVEL